MVKRKFVLTEQERKELTQACRQCKDTNTRTRFQAVHLYGEGHPEKEAEEITGCSRASLMEWCRAYRRDAAQNLVDKRAGGNSAKLTKYQIEDLQQRYRILTDLEAKPISYKSFETICGDTYKSRIVIQHQANSQMI